MLENISCKVILCFMLLTSELQILHSLSDPSQGFPPYVGLQVGIKKSIIEDIITCCT